MGYKKCACKTPARQLDLFRTQAEVRAYRCAICGGIVFVFDYDERIKKLGGRPNTWSHYLESMK